ncbi:60S ribosomal protein L7a-like isoform X1 [Canis lupus familiaris]|uniref:60S ribosomal protein L7a-like n=1 Tax=Canis lupus dingo TaxID=286419 RepID=UPI000DC69DEE|nr:60S ribosomal protein L7a-like isoform X1 [Canis lupus familiaris]XP_025274436.3 60S ribosomal protein L7a-like [Canis lupus dingo]
MEPPSPQPQPCRRREEGRPRDRRRPGPDAMNKQEAEKAASPLLEKRPESLGLGQDCGPRGPCLPRQLASRRELRRQRAGLQTRPQASPVSPPGPCTANGHSAASAGPDCRRGEEEAEKVQLVVIARDVDPIELVSSCLSCVVGWGPHRVSKGSAGKGRLVPVKTCPSVALTQVNSEDGGALAKLMKPSAPSTTDTMSTLTGVAHTAKLEKTKAKELASKLG